MSPLAYLVAAAIVAAAPEADVDGSVAEATTDTAVAGETAAPTETGTSVETGGTDATVGPTVDAAPAIEDRSPATDDEPTAAAPHSDSSLHSDSEDPPHRPSAALIKRRKEEARRGRALTIAGATLTGLGLAGRIGIDIFLATVADLAPREPFGQWSIGPIFMATTFSNVPTLVGVGLLGGGSYHQARAHGRRFNHPSSRRTKRTAWALLGSGLGLWGLSRALFIPWTRACQSNACAYGYLESTYFVSAGLAISGIVLAAQESGFRRAEEEETADYIKLHSRRRAPTLTPVVAPGFQGLSLSGRF